MTHWLQQTWRRFGWDGNPLRRNVDKAESLGLAALVVLLVILAPLVGVVAGRAADSAARQAQRAERSWYPVSAVLLAGTDQSASTQVEMGVAWVRADWTDREAVRHTGTVAAPLNARPGQRVQIWLTQAGRQTHQPLTATDVREQVAAAVLLAVTGWCVVITLAAAAVRLAADRRRMTGWHRDWEAAGPHWSRQG
jgi:hypothetical protein